MSLLVWAATKTSAALGNWNTAGTWTPSGVPTINDYVEIDHAVTIDTDAVCAGLKLDANLIPNPGKTLTIKDAAGTHATGEHIRITDATYGAWHSHATKASPFVVRSQNTGSPSYPIKILLMQVTGADDRGNIFDFCEFRDTAPFIGNQTDYIWLNTGDVTNDGILRPPEPVRRNLKIDEVYCEGRDQSRVYAEGGYAGTLDLAGLIPRTGYAWMTLAAMRDARARIGFIGQFVVMPNAIMEALSYSSRDGPYMPFSLTLIEDL